MDKNNKEFQLTDKEGAIVLRETSEPEIYAPIKVGESCDNIRFTLAFFLYAVEREDWIQEFGLFVDSIRDRQEDISADSRRAKFQIINGDKE